MRQQPQHIVIYRLLVRRFRITNSFHYSNGTYVSVCVCVYIYMCVCVCVCISPGSRVLSLHLVKWVKWLPCPPGVRVPLASSSGPHKEGPVTDQTHILHPPLSLSFSLSLSFLPPPQPSSCVCFLLCFSSVLFSYSPPFLLFSLSPSLSLPLSLSLP